MTYLDAYPLVALIADEPAADEVEGILDDGGARVAVINLAEALDIGSRVYGATGADLRAAIEPLLLSGVLTPAVSDESLGWLAGEIRARRYERRTSALSLADCFLLAHALTEDVSIATSDPAVAAVARAEGAAVVGLPDKAGKRP